MTAAPLTTTDSILDLGADARAAIAERLKRAALQAREAARRRRPRWVIEDVGRYRVAIRARHRPGAPGWGLELVVASRYPLTRPEAETLAKLAGVGAPILDEFPGNQIYVEEASWRRYAAKN